MTDKYLAGLGPFENLMLAIITICVVWLLARSLGVTGVTINKAGFIGGPLNDPAVNFLSMRDDTGTPSSKYEAFKMKRSGMKRAYRDGMLGGTEAPVFWSNQFADEDGITQGDLMAQEQDGDDGSAWSADMSITDASHPVMLDSFAKKRHRRRAGFDALGAALAGANVRS
jgi:hypothetical protein